jgi:hypothetical protein
VSEISAHVLINIGGRWGFWKPPAKRNSKLFASRRDAVRYGRAMARRDGITVYIHNTDGTVHSVVEPPKGTAKK